MKLHPTPPAPEPGFLLVTISALLASSLAVLAALPKADAQQPAGAQRPNVVLIIGDDHRHDWMHHKGKDYLETPHLDRLAAEGWSFPNAFACAGVCSPARASILTGKYMHQASAPTIVWQNNSFLQLQEMFPQTLHKHGYKTGYIGKFHLGEEEKPKPGFDLWASFPFVGNHFDQTIWIDGAPVPQQGFTDDTISGLATRTIREWSAASQPFCLVVGLKAPHIPFTYPERMKAKYEDVVFQVPETFDFDYSKTKPGLARNLINAKTWPHAIPKYGSFQEWVRAYTRLATTIDESVGQIMEAVEKAGIAGKTIFIYTSDQGYSLGELNMCEKHYAYEQIMRVPLVVRFPHQKNPGKPPADMVMNMDIAPTILDYCARNVPKTMEGKSWRELQDTENKTRKHFREEFFFDFWHEHREILPPMQAVRTDRYKLIKYEYQPYEELYDLSNDPAEKDNLAKDVQFASVKNDLEEKLRQWKQRTGWASRSSLKLSALYISKLLTPEEDAQEGTDYANPTIDDVLKHRAVWKKLERTNDGFDLSKHIRNADTNRVFYIAIPVSNRGEFDPFIEVRISFPGSNQQSTLAYTGYFEGKEIYRNVEYKKQLGIPMAVPEEASLRQGFDRAYNPPLKRGENVILLRVLSSNTTPKKWDVVAVGGLSTLKWH